MKKPKRIRLSRASGWRMPENTVHVARPGPWGNPFVVGRDGTAEECVAKYAQLLAGQLSRDGAADIERQNALLAHASAHLGDLRGKNLACWCKLDAPCHADVLLRLANG